MSNVDMSNCNSEENVVGASSTGDHEWKFHSTYDAVVSQFEQFHVDCSQQAKQTIESNAVKGENCSELDTTVENLTLSISAMNVASAPTEKETLEIRTVSTKKSHKLHVKNYPDKRHNKRVTGQYRSRSRRYKSRFGSMHVKKFKSISTRLEHLQIMWLEGLYRYFKFMRFPHGLSR